MSETALVSLSRIRLRSLLDKKVKGAETVRKLKNDQHRLLSTILVGNNLVNVAAASMATSIAFEIIPNYAVAVSTGVLTLLILIFGEIIPKSYATQHNIKISLAVSKPILFLSYVLGPISKVLEKITFLFVKPRKSPVVTEEDLKACVKLGEEAGFIKDIERDLLKNIFKFDDINVSEIMTPRPDMFCIDVDSKLKKVLKDIIKAGHTRIPVFEKDVHNIVGILNIKDLLPLLKKSMNVPIRKIMYRPFFVPENKKINSLLKQFRKRKEHMAIVVDEHGSVSGLVTLENVLEEIVGEIKDETDRIDPHVKKVGKGAWDILGKSDIEEVNKKIKSKFEEAEDYDTVSGMVLNHMGRIPKEEDEIQLDGYKIEVKEVEANRIVKVRIKK